MIMYICTCIRYNVVLMFMYSRSHLVSSRDKKLRLGGTHGQLKL